MVLLPFCPGTVRLAAVWSRTRIGAQQRAAKRVLTL